MPDARKDFDVFISFSGADRPAAREIAERLRGDGLNVWFDEWVLHADDNIAAKTEEGLEQSRTLLLCISANALGPQWKRLENHSFRFRDPLNNERRFLTVRLDDSMLQGSLAHFPHVDWFGSERQRQYENLIGACRPRAEKKATVNRDDATRVIADHMLKLDVSSGVADYVLGFDSNRVITCCHDGTLMVWDLKSGACLRKLKGHRHAVTCAAWSSDHSHMISGGDDKTLRLWRVGSEECLRVFEGHTGGIYGLAWSADNQRVLTCAMDKNVRLWDVQTGSCLNVFEGHQADVTAVKWTSRQDYAVSSSHDATVRMWDVETGQCVRVLEGHRSRIRCLDVSEASDQALSASEDNTVRLWDLDTGYCMSVLQAHSEAVRSISFASDSNYAVSATYSSELRLWELSTGKCLRVLEAEEGYIRRVFFSTDGRRVFSGDVSGRIQSWDLSTFLPSGPATTPDFQGATMPTGQIQYSNAKVLLVGDSGAGKTGLSKRLAGRKWEPSDSTVGAWATQWKLPVASSDGAEREIWLWDFGGQADQRLIHQLYMDETALAILVFDGQRENLFETLGQWDRDLTRASRRPFSKLLVAGRVDAGGLRVSRTEIERFVADRKFRSFLETSAKTNSGCEELRQAILDAINWRAIPCRTTDMMFKALKDEIIRLKDEGRVLVRFNELRETLQLRIAGRLDQFSDAELRIVISLLAGPGVVWRLAFGNWVLLQPERINAYAQAVIRTLQADALQRGCVMEDRVLSGDLQYESSIERLGADEERFVLLAMHQTLVERGLCLRQPTPKGNLLVFPSYYRRERPELASSRDVLVNYRFSGFLDEIYASLVVRLHHSEAFVQEQLWWYAADFRTNVGKQLGVRLVRRGPGIGDLEVYFDPTIGIEEKIVFTRYVHEHLLEHAKDVERLRHYVCKCGTPVGNREIAMRRLTDWLRGRAVEPAERKAFFTFRRRADAPSIVCVECLMQVPLWDEMEECFASPEIQARVRSMHAEASIELSNQSKERALVGEVISTVALADQICREFNVSDHGIDLEIEFTDDDHNATGVKLYLQLKSGDSYLRVRATDQAEVFRIKDERHAHYWMAQQFPVLLVIRNSEGEVRWMEIRDWLKRASEDGKKAVKQIVFEGERLDVMSVRRWRDRMLAQLPR